MKKTDVIYIYSRYLPCQRWNVDQVPLEFANKPRRVIDFKDTKQVWVSTSSAGLQKRQCSLILTINGDGNFFYFYLSNN
jgi:hypothetical protein